MAKISRDDVDKFFDYDLNIPTRTLYVGSASYSEDGGESGVDHLLCEKVLKGLHILDSLSDQPINIILNNPGGDYYHGIAIYDAIKNCRSHVTITVYGAAMSMGSIILQAADERVMSKNAKFMVHYGEYGLASNHPKINDNWAAEYKKVHEDMENLYLEKIREVNPHYTLQEVKSLLDFDTILNAEETVSLGLADRILGE